MKEVFVATFGRIEATWIDTETFTAQKHLHTKITDKIHQNDMQT